MNFLILTSLLISCSKVQPVPHEQDTRAIEAQIAYLETRAEQLADENGWLVSKSCDSMLWSGKACLQTTDLTAAESSTGQFFRTPAKTCFEESRSGSTWSRDMSLGLLNCLIEKKDLPAIERHIQYGDENGWIMGEGAPNRTYYTPALIGLWYKAARVLGHDYGYFETPNVYAKGLTDYQAHLQTIFIHIAGKLDGHISNRMRNRLKEHSSRIDNSPSYAAVFAKYGGSIDRALDLCLSDNNVVNDYVRCGGEACELAEQIFACKILLETLEGES